LVNKLKPFVTLQRVLSYNILQIKTNNIMNIFLGIIVNGENGEIVHSHVAESPDETFNVEIYDNNDKLMFIGEFRKWHHLEDAIKRKDLDLYPISVFKSIKATELMRLLNDKENANIF